MSLDDKKVRRLGPVRSVLLEALLITLAGLALALLANAVSPRGLKLSRNYFPTGAKPQSQNESNSIPLRNLPAAENFASTNPPATLIVVPRLAEKGLQGIDLAQARRFFNDPRRGLRAIVFVDARSEENFKLGHIPGALQFDPYHPEVGLPTVLAACKAAELVVVYCTGAECEDSELGAILLHDAGIPSSKLYVFVGGITEWTENKFPVETGVPAQEKSTK